MEATRMYLHERRGIVLKKSLYIVYILPYTVTIISLTYIHAILSVKYFI